MIVSRLAVSKSCLGAGSTTLCRAPIPSCHRRNRGATLTVAMRSTVRTPRRHRLDVVEGSGRSYVQSVIGVSGRRLSSTTATRSRSPWSAGKAMFRKRAGGPCRGRGLMSRAANPSAASGAVEWHGVCDERLARGGGAVHSGRRALVWCKSGVPTGISRCLGLPGGWAGGGGVVTRLSQLARNMVGRRGIR